MLPMYIVRYAAPGVGLTAVAPPPANMMYSTCPTSVVVSQPFWILYCALVKAERPGECRSSWASPCNKSKAASETTDLSGEKANANCADAKMPVPFSALQPS